jgi:hypothetical protein
MSDTPTVSHTSIITIPGAMPAKLRILLFLKGKLDRDLGFFYWKKYIAAAFWSQLATPINLMITLLTALTTAQATSPDLLSHSLYVNISIATLVITTLNTFFRPHTKMIENAETMKKWNELGLEFEKIYYSDTENNSISRDNCETMILKFTNLQERINDLRKEEGPSSTNFLTDLIHVICIYTCLRKYQRWLDNDRHIMNTLTEP